MSNANDNSGKVYKYLSSERFFQHIDKYLSGELFFSEWDKLNDPMEGFFTYKKSENNEALLDTIKDEKYSKRICTTSETMDNFLLWSHYADKHKGICLCIKIDDDKCNNNSIHHAKLIYAPEVSYIKEISDFDAEEQVKKILLTKLNYWEYENEYRFLIKDKEPGMYKIGTLEEIILGTKNLYIEFFKQYVDFKKIKVKVSRAIIDHTDGHITTCLLNGTEECRSAKPLPQDAR